MAKHEKKKSPAKSEAPGPRKVLVYLPNSNPPKKRLSLLIGLTVVAALWIALLVYLALQQVGVA